MAGHVGAGDYAPWVGDGLVIDTALVDVAGAVAPIGVRREAVRARSSQSARGARGDRGRRGVGAGRRGGRWRGRR